MARQLPLLLLTAPLLAGCLAQPEAVPDPAGLASPAYRALCDQLDGAAGWAEPCARLAGTNFSPSQTEIDIAVNPRDPRNVIVSSKDLDRMASNCVWAVPAATLDGGLTWTSVIIGGPRAQRWNDPTNPLSAWDCITDPILAFDAEGIAYYPLQTYNLASDGPECAYTHALAPVSSRVPGGLPLRCGYSFYLAVSRDGGLTWPNETIIPMALGDGAWLVHDYPRMLVNPATQTVSTVWNALGRAGVNPWVASTRDQGQSVDPPVLVMAPGAPRTTRFASGFAAASDGTVYMTVWAGGPAPGLGGGGGDGNPRPLLAVSTDDARSFSGFAPLPEVVPLDCPLPNTRFRCGTFVELAADASGGPRDGWLYAVWADNRTGDADIVMARSADRGATWTEPVRVNQDATTHAQFMSRIDVDGRGTLHVLYMDRSFDPGDRLYDAVHAWTADGGATWQSRRLTTVGSDGDLGIHQAGQPFIGDYVGLDAAGDHVWMGFPHTLRGRAEMAVAHAVAAS